MAKVGIVTDSTADIPSYLTEKYNITVIPLKVHIGGDHYLDGVDLSATAFYQHLQNSEEVPTTSQPSPHDFLEAYQRLIHQGITEILSIHLSSALSGTYQSAILAKEMLSDTEVTLELLDSKRASYALGRAVVAAAKAAQAGEDLVECRRAAEEFIQQHQVYFLVDTLEYLQKGGRIGKASALVGSLLNIKPVLSFTKTGEVYAVEKSRGRKKATQQMLKRFREQIPAGPISVAILHSNWEEEAKRWEEQIRGLPDFEVKELELTLIGPVVGTHAGPKTLGCLIAPWRGENR